MELNQSRIVVDESGDFIGEVGCNACIGDILKLSADTDGELLYWKVTDVSDTQIIVSKW